MESSFARSIVSENHPEIRLANNGITRPIQAVLSCLRKVPDMCGIHPELSTFGKVVQAIGVPTTLVSIFNEVHSGFSPYMPDWVAISFGATAAIIAAKGFSTYASSVTMRNSNAVALRLEALNVRLEGLKGDFRKIYSSIVELRPSEEEKQENANVAENKTEATESSYRQKFYYFCKEQVYFPPNLTRYQKLLLVNGVTLCATIGYVGGGHLFTTLVNFIGNYPAVTYVGKHVVGSIFAVTSFCTAGRVIRATYKNQSNLNNSESTPLDKVQCKSNSIITMRNAILEDLQLVKPNKTIPKSPVSELRVRFDEHSPSRRQEDTSSCTKAIIAKLNNYGVEAVRYLEKYTYSGLPINIRISCVVFSIFCSYYFYSVPSEVVQNLGGGDALAISVGTIMGALGTITNVEISSDNLSYGELVHKQGLVTAHLVEDKKMIERELQKVREAIAEQKTPQSEERSVQRDSQKNVEEVEDQPKKSCYQIVCNFFSRKEKKAGTPAPANDLELGFIPAKSSVSV